MKTFNTQRSTLNAQRRIKRIAICSAVFMLAHAALAEDIGKGWQSNNEGGDICIVNVQQRPDLPLPIKKPAGCAFTFPGSGGHVNYIIRRAQGGSHKFVVMKFRIDGDPKGQFKASDGGNPATMHLYFEKGTPLINAWWGRNNGVVLEQVLNKGSQTIKVPLTPENWGNIEGGGGDANKDAFTDALKNMGHCGFSIGGYQFGWGHGAKFVPSKGGKPAVMIVQSYEFTDS